MFMANTDKAGGLLQKFAITSRPDSFVFQYNFIPFGNNTAGAKIILTRYDDKQKWTDTLVNETVLITDTVSSTYKRIALYIGDKYQKTDFPDSGYVEFRPSMSGPATAGSYMTLDDIDLVQGDNASVATVNANTFLKITPNPVSDVAVISYDLKSSAPMHIGIYDLNGKEIQVVLNTVQHAGAHQSVVDVSALKAGVYLCKMLVGRDLVVQRIVVAQ